MSSVRFRHPAPDLVGRHLDRRIGAAQSVGELVGALELEEGEAQIAALLARNPDIKVDPILPDDVFGQEDWLQSPGFLRTFPYQLDLGTPEWSGMDGFFAARLKRNK